ncbi:MAG: hypothetical protein QNJ31_08390 [Candidatus Caenarcaniphilales bacterium]|nr:hypothetical protein [Candidatus Caenarcaniphilales bacterium]
MVNPVQNYNVPQRMYSPGQTAPGTYVPQDSSYPSENVTPSYPGDQTAQYQQQQPQISPAQLAYLQQLRQKQLEEQQSNPLMNFWNKLPQWGKIVLGIIGVGGTLYLGKLGFNNAYRVGDFFRRFTDPLSRTLTMGDSELRKAIYAQKDAENLQKVSKGDFERSQNLLRESERNVQSIENDLRNNYPWWKRVAARFQIGSEELKNQQRRRDKYADTRNLAKEEHQEITQVYTADSIEAFRREIEAREIAMARLEKNIELNNDRAAKFDPNSKEAKGYKKLNELIQNEYGIHQHNINQVEKSIEAIEGGNFGFDRSPALEEEYNKLILQDYEFQLLSPIQQMFAMLAGIINPSDPRQVPLKQKRAKATA